MKVFKQILAVVCAAYFLLAGSGYNLVRYCCEGCASEGIETVANKSCEAIHHEHEHEDGACCNHTHSASSGHKDMACSDTSHQTDGCHLLRLQTDIPAIVNASFEHIKFSSPLDFPIVIPDFFLHESVFQAEQTAFSPPYDIPLFSGRDILMYHAVLLI